MRHSVDIIVFVLIASAFATSIAAQEKDSYFTVGSTREAVIEAQGQPTRVSKYPRIQQETWWYGLSSVTFIEGKVSEWHNSVNSRYSLRISLGAQEPGAAGIRIGASTEEIVAAQGTPTRISFYPHLGEQIWWYKHSSVTFRGGEVTAWRNASNNLNIPKEEGPTEDVHVGLQSTREEVLKVIGPPQHVSSYPTLGEEVWWYGYSTVTFRNGVVAEWDYIDSLFRGQSTRHKVVEPGYPLKEMSTRAQYPFRD